MNEDPKNTNRSTVSAFLPQLPAEVAEIVHAYTTGESRQTFRLRDLHYDPEALDTLPVADTSTYECHWANGWFRHGCDGSLSLFPLLERHDFQEAQDEFAWIVERENESGNEHITVWRIHVLGPEDRDTSGLE